MRAERGSGPWTHHTVGAILSLLAINTSAGAQAKTRGGMAAVANPLAGWHALGPSCVDHRGGGFGTGDLNVPEHVDVLSSPLSNPVFTRVGRPSFSAHCSARGGWSVTGDRLEFWDSPKRAYSEASAMVIRYCRSASALAHSGRRQQRSDRERLYGR